MRRRSVTATVRSPLSLALALPLFFLCVCVNVLGTVGAQEIVAAFGDNNPDVVRRDYVEYDPLPGRGRGRRGAGPFGGVVPGFAALAGSSWLLWWNEGRHVRDARMLRRAEASVVILGFEEETDRTDGKLVHITGLIQTNGIVDTSFGLDRPDSLRLKRDTDAYQWLEERSEKKTRINEKQSRVDVTYRYHRDWSNRRVDSARFEKSSGHENPAALRMDPGAEFWTVNDAVLPNGLHLPPGLLDAGLGEFQPIRLGGGRGDDSKLQQYENAFIFGSRVYLPDDEMAQIGSGKSTSNSDTKSSGGATSKYSSSARNMAVSIASPRPALGDVRISWSEVPSPRRGVSVLARQEGDTLVPWKDDSTGHGIYALCVGNIPAHQMIRQLRDTSKRQTWIFRLVGWVGNFFGFKMMLSCIPYIVSHVPLYIGRLLEPIADLATSFVAAGGSIGLSAAVLSVAWLRFRPELAVALAAVSSGAFYAPLIYSRWKRKPEERNDVMHEVGRGAFDKQ